MSLLNLPDDQFGLLSLGLRMMSTPGNFGQALGQAGMGALGDVQQHSASKQRRAFTDLQTQQVRMQMEEAERQRRSQEALRGYMGGLDPDAGMTPDMPGPRREPQEFNAFQAIGRGADVGPALQMQQALQKATPQPIISKPGDIARDPVTGGIKWQNPAEQKPVNMNELLIPDGKGGYMINQPLLDARRQIAQAGATNIGLPKIDIKVGEGVAGQVGPLVASTREQALSGIKLVDSANRILSAAERGNLFAGPGANLLMKGAQVADVLGIGGKDTKEKIANTRTVVRAMAEQGVAARSQLGGQAQISNAEQELLTRATSGDIADLTAGEIVQIAQLNDRLGRQLYERHGQSLEALKNTPNTQNLMPFFQVPQLPPAFKPKARTPDQLFQDADAIINGGR